MFLWQLISFQAFIKWVKVYWIILKGYLRYKIITSQNVSSEAQVNNFFISKKHYVPFSSYSSFCIFNHPMIYKISDVITFSTWDWVYFWIYLLNHSKLGQLIDINRTTIFRNLLNNLDEWGWVPGSFQFSNLLQVLNNRLCQDSSVAFFWKSEWGAIRNSKFQLLKVALFRYIAIFIKS